MRYIEKDQEKTMVNISSANIQAKVIPFLDHYKTVSPEITKVLQEFNSLQRVLLREGHRVYGHHYYGFSPFSGYSLKNEAIKLLEMSRMGNEVFCSYADVQILNNLDSSNTEAYLQKCRAALETAKDDIERLKKKKDFEDPFNRIMPTKPKEDKTPDEAKEEPNLLTGILFIAAMGMIVLLLTQLAS